MKIVYIAGISGFIGRHLEISLNASGFVVRGIYRNDFMLTEEDFAKKISDADIIINLAGSPIDGRWTNKYKENLINSRILTTSKITNAIINNPRKPELFISASATGIYNSEGIQDEFSPVSANDFLKKLCISWEAEAQKAALYTNVAICRLGIVLSPKGGALKKMLNLYKYVPATQMGNGNQIMSWIHLTDLLSAFILLFRIKKQAL
ncbi:MAG: Epimerase family protein [Bacteroidetes bacterium ADurb.Bin408]|nr:MAG: Epimerase family protein [Bacteroidetes bacterium ADurb.Bin408]